MVWLNALCTLYCVPWSKYIHVPWVGKVFLIDNWIWLVVMIVITLWYWLGLIWTDRNNVWLESDPEQA